MKLIHVVGARPNFMKIAPLLHTLNCRRGVENLLVHTGQHYDQRMSETFFQELGIPAPDVNLGVGSGSHAAQTAEVMKRFEPVLQEHAPDVVVVAGDVNSTLACALVASKLHVRIAHVEAGLRSHDMRMPEEINRILTDRLSDLLFTPSRDGDQNLLAEGIPKERIHFVGNIMIDSLLEQLEAARALRMPEQLGLDRTPYILVTLHRPSNVDAPEQLAEIFSALRTLAGDRVVLFPMHPRTRSNAERFGLLDRLGDVRVLDALGYREMIGLTAAAELVLTDSGGVQEETTALGVPCLTLRDSTERPVTVDEGTNTIVLDRSTHGILAAVAAASRKRGCIPELWDGHTAARIATVLVG